MPVILRDPSDDLKDRKRQIDTMDPYQGGMDEKELREREEAAKAYAGESEKHFVDYAMDCLKQSIEAQKDIRRIQNDCWNVYNENEPVSYRDKAAWQSRVVIPKPFETVQFGATSVKKAFSPNFLSIESAKNEKQAEFWKKWLDFQLDKRHGNFVQRFTDATVMALAVGNSMEMIPRWIKGEGLEYALVEPWKIQRDPDALSRDSQGGLYWIHQEWLDFFVLKRMEQSGRYFDVDRVKSVEGEDASDPFMTKEAIAARKGMIWERSRFRKMVLASEYWGVVLDNKGELLLPRATYTIAGGRVIQKPESSPYRTLRWPGVSFSPLPDLLRFGGRGLLEGILTIWEAINNIICLHIDALQWIVNPETEINVDALVDPGDVIGWPGKTILTRDTINGQAAKRVVQRHSRTSDVLANVQYFDQVYQRGSLVPENVQGLPGWRQNMTWRESQQLLEQALGVFGMMGENLEDGAIAALEAAAEVSYYQAGYPDYLEAFTEEELQGYGIYPNTETPNGVSGVPPFTGTFHVSGIQALLKDNETLQALKEVIIPLADHPAFAPYINAHKALKAIEIRTNMTDEGIIATDDEAGVIRVQERLAQAQEKGAMGKLQKLQEALGVADLNQKLQAIEASDLEQVMARVNALWGERPDGGRNTAGTAHQSGHA